MKVRTVHWNFFFFFCRFYRIGGSSCYIARRCLLGLICFFFCPCMFFTSRHLLPGVRLCTNTEQDSEIFPLCVFVFFFVFFKLLCWDTDFSNVFCLSLAVSYCIVSAFVHVQWVDSWPELCPFTFRTMTSRLECSYCRLLVFSIPICDSSP